MQHKNAIACVDHTFGDILDKDIPFGGVTVIFGGDFDNSSSNSSWAQAIDDCCFCQERDHIQIHYLVQNMRLDQTPDNVAHVAWLLYISAGRNLGLEETMQILVAMICNHNSITGLISTTYSHIDHP